MHIRQSTLALMPEDWNALNEAISTLMRNGIYEELVQIHTEMSQEEPDGFQASWHLMHGSMSGPLGYRRFLPWHRAYLIVFERELREINPALSIPYWDWNADGGWLAGFPDPENPLFPEGSRWRRNPGTRQGEQRQPRRAPWFTSEANIQRAFERFDNYYDFTRWLEREPHNRGHGWIGGHMNLMSSPRDPAFWFHHAQVDRLWAQWQEAHPGQRAHLVGRDAQLDPWQDEFTVESVDNTLGLGHDSYEYAAPPNRREVV